MIDTMANCASHELKKQSYTISQSRGFLTAENNGFLPSTTHVNNVATRHEAAKAVIETTLRKSAGILSEFTENTITQTNAFFNKILAPERFGFTSNPIITQSRIIRPGDPGTQVNIPFHSVGVERKKPDISKLPPTIADILREDSNSSIPETNKPKKYHYHSKKMALKQRDESSKEKLHALTTPLTENTAAPRIVLVSTPLTSQQGSVTKDAMSQKINDNNNGSLMIPQDFSLVQTKTEKKMGASVNISSIIRKPEKSNIGVENGVAFVLGSKTKSPYFNTFADTDVDCRSGDTRESSRKWVVNVGNFLDDEISLALMGWNLTITGFRQPSLKYPEGQMVSETIALPPGFDVNKLRIYRAKDAKAFLVIQEKQQPVP